MTTNSHDNPQDQKSMIDRLQSPAAELRHQASNARAVAIVLEDAARCIDEERQPDEYLVKAHRVADIIARRSLSIASDIYKLGVELEQCPKCRLDAEVEMAARPVAVAIDAERWDDALAGLEDLERRYGIHPDVVRLRTIYDLDRKFITEPPETTAAEFLLSVWPTFDGDPRRGLQALALHLRADPKWREIMASESK